MTGQEALVAFTLAVAQASGEAGIEVPKVREVILACPADGPCTLAETVPGEIRVNSVVIVRAATWPKRREWAAREWLRCIARHEVTHRALGHVAVSRAEAGRLELEVGPFMRETWGERDPVCRGYVKWSAPEAGRVR